MSEKIESEIFVFSVRENDDVPACFLIGGVGALPGQSLSTTNLSNNGSNNHHATGQQAAL